MKFYIIRHAKVNMRWPKSVLRMNLIKPVKNMMEQILLLFKVP